MLKSKSNLTWAKHDLNNDAIFKLLLQRFVRITIEDGMWELLTRGHFTSPIATLFDYNYKCSLPIIFSVESYDTIIISSGFLSNLGIISALVTSQKLGRNKPHQILEPSTLFWHVQSANTRRQQEAKKSHNCHFWVNNP